MSYLWVFVASIGGVIAIEILKGLVGLVMDCLALRALDRGEERIAHAITDLVRSLREPPRRKQDWSPREEPALWKEK